ncbi:MAG TPA: HD domain-containing protein [Tenuifilaceae bacterium]|nr:HD domain-containing protein [Tenuifilaceae bacterium]
MLETNKKKIVNDPVHGFINISYPVCFDIIEHPYFQRLRHIRQLGLTYLVYPGANHTRFQHAIGAMHLMETAINVLRAKGHNISYEEAEGASIAILLHDIGHGPFSHSLEHSIVQGAEHEIISRSFMQELNRQMNGKLLLATKIFEGTYHKNFLHQLVSSQLDMDRMDYLRRDSFFTGVTEGTIGSERIIKMLNVVNDELVVEAKGIYSIEKFLIARRLMYWQVYLHKTVVAAEQTLIRLLQRARELALNNQELFCTPSLRFFLENSISKVDFEKSVKGEQPNKLLEHFSNLDDSDIMVAAKSWTNHPDKVLSNLSRMIVLRKLFRLELSNNPFPESYIDEKKVLFGKIHPELSNNGKFFVFSDSVSNNAYQVTDDSIKILYNSGKTIDITEASDMLSSNMLSKEIRKYFLCYPKSVK